jgi:cephalosporin hydroxylase
MTIKQEGDAYLDWWFNSKVWKNTQYRGIRTLKFPVDMWNYQELIFANDIHWVIECGTRHGGSAVYFADLLELKKAEGGVVTIDINKPEIHPLAWNDPRIEVLIGNSADPAIVDAAFGFLPEDRKKALLILDSDHQKAHVRKELDAYVPRLKSGDYLVVEDTLLDHQGDRVASFGGPGPYEAIHEYAEENPGMISRDISREIKYGATVAPYGYWFKV